MATTAVARRRAWKPKAWQRAVVELLTDPDRDLTVTAACNELGIDNSNYYHTLRRSPEFAQYVQRAHEVAVDQNVARVHKRIIHKALHSDEKVAHRYCYMTLNAAGRFAHQDVGAQGDRSSTHAHLHLHLGDHAPRDVARIERALTRAGALTPRTRVIDAEPCQVERDHASS